MVPKARAKYPFLRNLGIFSDNSDHRPGNCIINYKADYIKPLCLRDWRRKEKTKNNGQREFLNDSLCPLLVNQLKIMNLSLVLHREDSTSL